jgi:hypothetical protein
VRQRVACLQRVELLPRVGHCGDGAANRFGHRVGGGRSAAASGQSTAPIARALHLGKHGARARMDFLLCPRDRANIGRGLPARFAAAAIEIPRRGNDVLLRLNEILERLVVPSAGACALVLGRGEFLFERRDFEEEDVASRFARPFSAADIARTRVIGDHVAGTDVEIFEIQGALAAHRRCRSASRKWHRLFGAAAGRIDQVERRHAKVVIGARLDCHLLQWRDLSIAGRTNDPHIRRPILQRTDEILGIARVAQSIGIRQRNPVRTVVRNRQLAL